MKVVAITGCRSEYDILFPVINEIRKNKHSVKLIVSGSHLSNWHGNSFREIKKDGFKLAAKIYSNLKTEKKNKRTKAIAILIKEITKCVESEKPDFLICVGDREESIAAAIVGNYMNILFVHLAGGDPVWGHTDDPIRFAVSKLAHIHFPFTKKFADNLIKIGEEKYRICVSGNPSLDNIRNTKKISLQKLSERLGVKLTRKYFVLIKHPLSLEESKSSTQMKITLKALRDFCTENNMKVIIIYPNTDPGAYGIIKIIKIYKKKNEIFSVFKNLPHNEFVNLIRNASVLVGNSSMGFLEAPYYKLPVVNIGRRQRGRLNAGNVEFVNYSHDAIIKSLKKACFNKQYKEKINKISNPFGNGYASKKIVKFLQSINIKDKKWYIKKQLC